MKKAKESENVLEFIIDDELFIFIKNKNPDIAKNDASLRQIVF